MWIAVLLLFMGCGVFFRSLYERKTLSVSRYELETDKIRTDKTFVFLSDLHDNCFGEGQNTLLEAIKREKPDGVLIGGDMMVVKSKADTGAALFLVEKLAGQYPVYYGNGNHENRMDQNRDQYGGQYDEFQNRLKRLGVFHLSDESAGLGNHIQIYGLNIEEPYYKKFQNKAMEKGYIEKRLGKADEGKYCILLAHSPMFHKAYVQWGADLALSGHFHGGTIRIPGLGGLMTPQFQFFVKCCGGIHRIHDKVMIVSRGLGTHSINIRLNNKPELVVIHLKAASYRA